MKPYKRKPGEFEIRILPDGRVLIPAPNEALLEVANLLNQPDAKPCSKKRAKRNERAKTSSARQRANPKRSHIDDARGRRAND